MSVPQFTMTLVSHACSCSQDFFRHHTTLIDLVLICQVMAERACRHHLVVLMTLHFPTVPFLRWHQSFPHLVVGCCRELSSDSPRCANHCMRFLYVGLKTYTCKEVDEYSHRPLEKFGVSRGQICVIHVKITKKVAISSVIASSSSSLSSPNCRYHSLATALRRMLKIFDDKGLLCIMPRPD